MLIYSQIIGKITHSTLHCLGYPNLLGNNNYHYSSFRYVFCHFLCIFSQVFRLLAYGLWYKCSCPWPCVTTKPTMRCARASHDVIRGKVYYTGRNDNNTTHGNKVLHENVKILANRKDKQNNWASLKIIKNTATR